MFVLCLVAQLCLTFCNPMDCSPPGSPVCGDSPGTNTGVSCHVLLHGIFPTQESNPGLQHCRWILYCLSHQGSPCLYYICSMYMVLLQHPFPIVVFRVSLTVLSLLLVFPHKLINSTKIADFSSQLF